MHDAHTDTFAPVKRKWEESTAHRNLILSSIFTFCARIRFLFNSFNTILLAVDVANECRRMRCASSIVGVHFIWLVRLSRESQSRLWAIASSEGIFERIKTPTDT